MQFDVPKQSAALGLEDGVLPLINIVFLLLVFFMVAGSLATATPFPIEPLSSDSATPQSQDVRLVLFGKNGELALDNTIVTRAQLLAETANLSTADASSSLLQINAHADADAHALARLLDDMRAAGIEKIELLSLLPTESPTKTP
ncbi:MAG: biopolymer transporter ExbD [Pseudomonadota bacterium]